jgi:ketosteroid isomerase-like protein
VSQENVELVRAFYETFSEWMAAYFADPRPLEESAKVEQMLDYFAPEAEWRWLFSSQAPRGHHELLRAAADWIETVDYWRIEVDELIDAGDDRVLASVRVLARGKGGGVPVEEKLCSVFTGRGGKVISLDDYLARAEALKAVGLQE